MSTLAPCLRRVLCGVVLLACSPTASPAADPDAGRLLGEDAVVRVEIDRPLRLLHHPLVLNVWREIQQSPDYQRQREAPEWDRVQQVRTYLEAALETGWREAADRLTASGIVLEFAPGPPPQFALVVAADRPETMSQFVEFAQTWIRQRLAERGHHQPWATVDHRGHTCFQIGNAHVAALGKHLCLTSNADVLKQLLDRLLDGPATARHPAAAGDTKPLVRWRLDMEQIRRLPNMTEGLKVPSDDVGRMAILGGWVDLLRRSNWADGQIELNEQALSLRIRLDAGSEDVTPGLSGYFAGESDASLAPLLTPPGTLFTASWCRDYAALWRGRTDSLDEDALKRLEDGDETAQKQFQQFGVREPPSKVFQLLGTQFRVVAARQQSLPYRVEPDDRLPAAALVVNLPDVDAFRGSVEPFFRTLSLIAAVGEAHMLTKSTEYRDAKLHGVRFRDDRLGAEQSNQLRYSLSPTYSITRDHFILASGEEIVRHVIDELDRQRDGKVKPPPAGTTNLGRLSLAEAGQALEDVKELFVRGAVFQTGMTLDESEQALEVVKQILNSIGQISYRATYNREGFEYRIDFGPASPGDGSR